MFTKFKIVVGKLFFNLEELSGKGVKRDDADLSKSISHVTQYVKLNCAATFFPLKLALQILGQNFSKNTKISSLYSQSLLIFIHKNPDSQKPSDNKRN